MAELAPPPALVMPCPPQWLEPLPGDPSAPAESYASDVRAKNTRITYLREWRQFCAWSVAQGLSALPAEPVTVKRYLAHLADKGRAAAGIELALVAIGQAHKLTGHPSPRADPVVQEEHKGIRRALGTKPKEKAALLVEQLRTIVEALPRSAVGIRDRALLVLGFVGAFRRSELVALDLADLSFGRDGLTVHLRRSKTDQEGAGRVIAAPHGSSPVTCPVRAVRAWLKLLQGWMAERGLTTGPLFVGMSRWGKPTWQRLDGSDVARVLKRRAAAVGLDPALYAGHSLRAGFVTTAARAGKSDRAIMDQTGHRSIAMLFRYKRSGRLFEDCAARGIGT